jgi:hypothetical protein
LPHVAISHVIGTVGLLAILSIVLVISTTISAQNSAQSVQTGFQEVASYVSNQLVAFGSLTASTQNPSVVAYKILELPPSIGSIGYVVTVVNDSVGWKVMVYAENNVHLNANATLSFATDIWILPVSPPSVPVTITELVHSGEGSSLATATLTAVMVFQMANGYASVGLGVSTVGRNL